MTIESEIQTGLQTLQPLPNDEITGKLGYFVRGEMRVKVQRKFSMFYVRFVDGSFVEAFHDGKVRAVEGIQVDLVIDSNGYFHITGLNSKEAAAYLAVYGSGILLPEHTHILDDMDWIGVKSAAIGKVLYGNGTTFDSVDLSDYALTHVAIAGTGLVVKTAMTTYITLAINQNGSGAPTVDDDVTFGYGVGSWWYDDIGDIFYDCKDATNGAAVWEERGGVPEPVVIGQYRQYLFETIAGVPTFLEEDGEFLMETFDLE